MRDLATMLRTRRLGAADVEAVKWLREATAKGDVYARKSLAEILAVGSQGYAGVAADEAEAARLAIVASEAAGAPANPGQWVFNPHPGAPFTVAELEKFPIGVRRKLQEQLTRAGLDKGAIDGVLGSGFDAAWTELRKRPARK